jgi:hypothetical protein
VTVNDYLLRPCYQWINESVQDCLGFNDVPLKDSSIQKQKRIHKSTILQLLFSIPQLFIHKQSSDIYQTQLNINHRVFNTFLLIFDTI